MSAEMNTRTPPIHVIYVNSRGTVSKLRALGDRKSTFEIAVAGYGESPPITPLTPSIHFPEMHFHDTPSRLVLFELDVTGELFDTPFDGPETDPTAVL